MRIIHLETRMGLIRARLKGALEATGDVLIFVDAHCEATIMWAEPLLARIETDRTTVVVPIIDTIKDDTLAYENYGTSTYEVGGFTWSGEFTWIRIPNEQERDYFTPVKSPTMLGAVFAIERTFFWQIGSFDEQMDGWGGDNLELSFR